MECVEAKWLRKGEGGLSCGQKIALRWVERKVFRTGLGLESEEGGTCRGFRTNDSKVVNDGEAEKWLNRYSKGNGGKNVTLTNTIAGGD